MPEPDQPYKDASNAAAAKAMWAMYTAYLEVGFSKEQALELIKAIILKTLSS